MARPAAYGHGGGGNVHGDDGLPAAPEGRDAAAAALCPPAMGGERQANPNLAACGGRASHPYGGRGGHGEAGGVGRGGVLGLCTGGQRGLGMGSRYCEPAQEAALQGRGLLPVLREYLRSVGPVCRAYRSTTGDVPQATAVFVEVPQPPRVPGQDVWPVARSNMWQAEHAAAMCRAL